MIIHWKPNRVKVVPIVAKNSPTVVGKVTLMPGNNVITDSEWDGIKDNLKYELEKGLISEIVQEIPEVDKEGKETGKKVTVKEFRKMEAERAEEIVKDTYNLKTLKSWKKNESRDSVRAAIQNQIDAIEEGNADREKKQKKESKKNEG